jgi:WD40 repeat protein
MNTLDPVGYAIKYEINSLNNGFNSRYEIDQHLLQKGYAPADIDAAWQSLQPSNDADRKTSNLIEFITRPLVMLGITVLLGLLILLNGFLRPFEDRTYTTIVAPQIEEVSLKTTAFSPNGKYLSSLNAVGELFIWEIPGRRLVKTLIVQVNPKYSTGQVFWSADSQIVMGTHDDVARVFRVENGVQLFSLAYRKDTAAPAFSPNGRFIVHNPKPNQLSIVDITSGAEVKSVIGNWRENYTIRSLQFSPDSKFVAAELPDRMWFWDTENEQNFYIQKNLNGYEIYDYNFSPDGKYFAIVMMDERPKIQIWDWRNRVLLREINRNYPGGFKPIFSPDNEWLIFNDKTLSPFGGYADEVADIVQITNIKPTSSKIALQNLYVRDLDFSPDGRTLVITSYDKLLLRSTADLLK